MLGRIGFENLHILCTIGIDEEERKREQKIYIDVAVEIDFSDCIASDQVTDTVCYVELANICHQTARSKHYNLLETLAKDLLDKFLQRFKRIQAASIKIKKPNALKNAQYATVELSKRRGGT